MSLKTNASGRLTDWADALYGKLEYIPAKNTSKPKPPDFDLARWNARMRASPGFDTAEKCRQAAALYRGDAWRNEFRAHLTALQSKAQHAAGDYPGAYDSSKQVAEITKETRFYYQAAGALDRYQSVVARRRTALDAAVPAVRPPAPRPGMHTAMCVAAAIAFSSSCTAAMPAARRTFERYKPQSTQAALVHLLALKRRLC